MILRLVILLCISSIVLAGSSNLTDEEKIEADIHKIISDYKENPKGFVEIKDRDEIKIYNDNVDESIKVNKYYEIVVSANERTTKTFSEGNNIAIVFRGDIDEYAVEITHKTKQTKDETFNPSQPIVVIAGNKSRYNFTVRVARIPQIK